MVTWLKKVYVAYTPLSYHLPTSYLSLYQPYYSIASTVPDAVSSPLSLPFLLTVEDLGTVANGGVVAVSQPILLLVRNTISIIHITTFQDVHHLQSTARCHNLVHLHRSLYLLLLVPFIPCPHRHLGALRLLKLIPHMLHIPFAPSTMGMYLAHHLAVAPDHSLSPDESSEY